jgi:hypothetical protein
MRLGSELSSPKRTKIQKIISPAKQFRMVTTEARRHQLVELPNLRTDIKRLFVVFVGGLGGLLKLPIGFLE